MESSETTNLTCEGNGTSRARDIAGRSEWSRRLSQGNVGGKRQPGTGSPCGTVVTVRAAPHRDGRVAGRVLPIRDATTLRSGALAGMLSALVAVAFNAIHPRAPSDSLNDTRELLRIVAASRSWRLVHLASVVATLAGVAAIVAVLWSMVLQGSNRWPAVAFVLLVLTTPTLLLSVGLDGFAMKSIADRWADASANRETLMSAATALRSVDVAVLDIVMIGQFGLTAILLGVASWESPLYGPGIGAIAIAGGALGVLCGVMQALSGRLTVLSYLVLLTVSLALFTVWLTTASFVLWRKVEGLLR